MFADENPFAAESLARPHRLHGTTWDAVLERWESLGRRAEIVGQRGSGKTTFLHRFARELRQRGNPVVLFRVQDRGELKLLPEVAPNETLLLDDAGISTALDRLRIRLRYRRAHGLVVTSHRPTSLSTLYDCRVDEAFARELLYEIAGDDAAEYESQFARFFREHDRNLHSVFLALYDVAAER